MLNIKVLTAKATIGDPVQSVDREYLGEISDVILDETGSEPIFAVLTIRDKEFVVPFSHLTFVGEEGYFVFPKPADFILTCSEKITFKGKTYYSCMV